MQLLTLKSGDVIVFENNIRVAVVTVPGGYVQVSVRGEDEFNPVRYVIQPAEEVGMDTFPTRSGDLEDTDLLPKIDLKVRDD